MQSDIVGIFATHQHDLLDARLGLQQQLQRSFCCHMHVVPSAPPAAFAEAAAAAAASAGGRQEVVPQAAEAAEVTWLQPTFRVVPGSSCDSLAFQVAFEEVRRPPRSCLPLWTAAHLCLMP